ncbi:MAG TPA: hypothetical protein VJP77_03150 [Planctomycetota bacterium]|nr:hypothetical protein [Planctomycetota bacterium]
MRRASPLRLLARLSFPVLVALLAVPAETQRTALGATVTVRGVLRDADGRRGAPPEVEGLAIVVRRDDEVVGRTEVARPPRFELVVPRAPGVHEVAIEAPGWQRRTTRFRLDARSSDLVRVQLDAVPGNTVRVRTTDGDRDGVFARPEVGRLDERGRVHPVPNPTRIGPDGTGAAELHLGPLPDGTRLAVWCEEQGVGASAPVEAAEDAVLRLEAAGDGVLRIAVLGLDGARLTSAPVAVLHADPGVRGLGDPAGLVYARGWTDRAGRVAFAGLRPGAYRVACSVRDGGGAEYEEQRERLVADGREHGVVVARHRLVLEAVDAEGLPVDLTLVPAGEGLPLRELDSGAFVRLVPTDGSRAPSFVQAPGAPLAALLRSGVEYELTAGSPARGIVVQRFVAPRRPGPESLVVTLPAAAAPGILHLRVRGLDPTAYGSVHVDDLATGRTRFVGSVQTSPTVEFAAARTTLVLPAGSWRVRVSAPQDSGVTCMASPVRPALAPDVALARDLASGESRSLELELVRPGTVAVTVRDLGALRDAAGWRGAHYDEFDAGAGVALALARADGSRIALDEDAPFVPTAARTALPTPVAPGVYTLVASAPGFVFTPVPVSVTAGEAAEVELVWRRAH